MPSERLTTKMPCQTNPQAESTGLPASQTLAGIPLRDIDGPFATTPHVSERADGMTPPFGWNTDCVEREGGDCPGCTESVEAGVDDDVH